MDIRVKSTFEMPHSTTAPLSRRSFLTLALKSLLGTSGLFALAGILKFLSYQPDPSPPTQFDLGPASDYPPGSRTVITDARAVLLNTPQGFQALSLVCPHLGCTVDPQSQGFTCPCHGSRFALDGSFISGPANQPLRQLTVEENPDKRLILHTG